MTRAKTFLVMLVVVGVSAGAALGQAATKTTVLEVNYNIDRDASNSWNSAEQRSNQGGEAWLRIKNFDHVYHGDWDTDAMAADIVAGQPLVTGWNAYTPTYYLAIKGVPGSFPVDPPFEVFISSVWSTNDWVEGDGPGNYVNYNWTNAGLTFASTYTYAQDMENMVGAEIPWAFPGGGTGPNAPYDADPDCGFGGTFHTLADNRPGGTMDPGSGEAMTPTNAATFLLSYVDEGQYREVQLDQAIIDDMLTNENNRGLALYDWVWVSGLNPSIYSDDQNILDWPHIYARIEVCSGDGNLDQAIDGLDYVIWSNNYNTGTTWGTGDWNQDLIADGLDYVVWSNNYQKTCPGVPGAVPEPATMVLLAIGGLALIRRRR